MISVSTEFQLSEIIPENYNFINNYEEMHELTLIPGNIPRLLLFNGSQNLTYTSSKLFLACIFYYCLSS